MPHKHKRKADNDDSHYSLPPTELAAPLPVGKGRAANPAPRNKKRKVATIEGYGHDDTPKAFARLMQFSKTGKRRSGLDDGHVKTKKERKQERLQKQQQQQQVEAEDAKQDTTQSESQPQALKIKPGEKMSEFSQRVNQALPLTGLQKSGKKIAGVSDHRVTKHERRLKKLQQGWREEEARIRDKEQEERELAEEEQDELDAMWEDKTADLDTAMGKKKKKGKRKLVVGEVDDKIEDEWAALRKKREERKGLHDVAQAPPQFDRIPREIFKVKNGAKVNVGNVPTAAGSLRKREELGAERLTIIDTYRKLMAEKRGD
ncbi:hypothetical protein BS50DRAFT_635105 [Corynespora cassiicola Philippines]|uniref:Uncharacterized protein n=1 Tax=Corynespora cassiicola Philippines TaxID=1448308 RepID=A0A2T2NKD7_CORCC|nr:hypothetical protein BS50DRAFT_635105 [Corynespora cassiicola Philippines]